MTDFLKSAVSAVVLRGIPGSGKSTLQKKKWPKASVVSADFFFMHTPECKELQRDPKNWLQLFSSCTCPQDYYNFDPSKLGEAHGQSLRSFINICKTLARSDVKGASFDTIVVDNTGISLVEIAPYVAVAQAYSIPVKVVTVACPAELAAGRNVHGVPVENVLKMHDRLVKSTQEIPPWWNHEIHLSQ